MSGAAHADDHGQGAGHGHGQDAHGHGSFKDYVTGFVLSVILTAIPFWLVMGDVLGDKLITGVVILGLGAVQIVVHMIYFLHMNTKSEGGWTFMALIFTITLVVITLCGSIWVMHHLNTNMMPISPEEMRHAP
jgi:cytochrome o ubiquinol oxidase operon protein cyoD